MSKEETDILVNKITQGIKLAVQRLIEKTRKEDGELVISKNGKVVRIRARELSDKQS